MAGTSSKSAGPARSSTCDAANDDMDQTAANGWLTNAAAHQLFAAAGQDLDALTARRQAAGLPRRAAGLQGVDDARQRDQRQASQNVDRHPAGHDAAERICPLHRALGPSRPLRGDAGGDRHLQRRGRQCQRHRRRWSRWPRPMPGPGRPTAARLPGGDRRGIGPARLGLLCRPPVFPLAQTVGGVNMDALTSPAPPRLRRRRRAASRELDDYLARAAAHDRRARAHRSRPRRRAIITAPTISASPNWACRCSTAERGEDLVNGGPAAGAAAAQDYSAQPLSPAVGDEYDRNWDWTGAMRDLQSITTSAASWRRRRLAELEPGDEFRAIRDRSRAGR